MSLLTDPTIQAALQAVNADQEELRKSEEELAKAEEAASVARSIVGNARLHLAVDVQGLYDAITAATKIGPK